MCMQSYLQLQELWDVTSRVHRMPAQPQPSTTGTSDWVVRMPPTDEQMAEYIAAFAKWNMEDNKAMSMLTLRINAKLHHYQTANQTTCNLWQVLAQTFGTPSMSAVYTDFKQVIRLGQSSP